MNCPVCGEEKRASYLETPEAILVRCLGCNLIRRERLNVSEESYEGSYFEGSQRYLERWDELVASFRPLVRKIRSFQPRGKFLDVGCGIGALLWTARESGFDVQGVEYSPWAADFARREKVIPVHSGTLDTAVLQPETFDVVVFNHVLEHLQNPLLELKEAYRLLKPRGVLVVGVPNIGSFMAHIKGASWGSLLVREHRLFFTPETLSYMLNQASFRVLDIQARENHPVHGWRIQDVIRRGINLMARITNHSEAMLVFATHGATASSFSSRDIHPSFSDAKLENSR